MTSLHWLPVPERIKFKVALLAHKAQMTGMPSYIASTLSPHSHVRSLRSESSNFLNIPIPRNKFEAKSFKFSAPRTWNGLPPQLRASDSFSLFKANLKTHLFPQQRRTKRPWRLRLWRSINKYIIILLLLLWKNPRFSQSETIIECALQWLLHAVGIAEFRVSLLRPSSCTNIVCHRTLYMTGIVCCSKSF